MCQIYFFFPIFNVAGTIGRYKPTVSNHRVKIASKKQKDRPTICMPGQVKAGYIQLIYIL